MKRAISSILLLVLLFSVCSVNAESSTGPEQLTGFISHVSNMDVFPFPVMADIEEQSNVQVDWTVYERRDWISRKSVILSSEELPDVMVGCTLQDSDVNGGLFLDLTPYLDLMPNVQAFFEAIPSARAMATAADGKIYALPNYIALRPQSGDVLYVNKTWCDQLDVELPKTTEEYYNMLVRFRDEDPNGNGLKDEIGYTSYGMLSGTSDFLVTAGYLGWIFPAFGVVTNHSDTYCMVKNGVPEFQPMTDNYRSALEYISKLYAEGLIDQEFFTMGFPEAAAKFQNDPLIIGSGSGWMPNTFAAANADHYVAIEPLEGPNGDKYWNASDYFYKMTANMAAIPASSTNPEAAASFINSCYDQWNGLQLTYGSEGISLTLNDEGNPEFLTPPEGHTDDEWTMINSLGVGAPTWCSPEYEATISGESTVLSKPIIDQFYSEWFLDESKMPFMNYDSATQDELSILKTDINTFVQQSIANFTVNGITDQSWNDYLEQLHRMGVDRLIEIYTDGYNVAVK